MSRIIAWSNQAIKEFENAVTFISEDSIDSAEKLRRKILKQIAALISNPERYPIDKFKKDNDGTIRAFELKHYRIAYKITAANIVILRVRHVKREPKKY